MFIIDVDGTYTKARVQCLANCGCATAALNVKGRSAHEILGSPDDLKLRSCATLFARVSLEGSVFQQLLEKFYDGEPDSETLRLLEGQTER